MREEIGTGRRPLSLRDNLLYSVGQFACSCYGFIVLPWVLYLYRGNADAGLPPLVPEVMFGAVFFAGRLFDAVTDPLVGYLSDRTKSAWGRRKPFIAAGALPMAVCFLMLWRPPAAYETTGNGVYLLVVLCGFFLGFTLVFGPYLAMLPELTHNDAERNSLATNQAAFNVLGNIVGAVFGLLYAVFLRLAPPANPIHGFFVPALVVAGLATLSLVGPLLGRREEPADQATPTLGVFRTLGQTLTNKPFQRYIAAFFFVWFAVQLLLAALPHLPVARLNAPAGSNEVYATALQATVLLAAALSFPLIKEVMRRRGRGYTYMAGMLWMAVVAPLLVLVHSLPMAVVVLLIAGPGVGALLVLPHAVLADICDHDAHCVGERREAIFFGMQGLLTKAAIAMAMVLANALLTRLGNTAAQPLGVVACPLIAALLLVCACLAFRGYEKVLTLPEGLSG
jgi:Na+/melibiose symporter-like transporter